MSRVFDDCMKRYRCAPCREVDMLSCGGSIKIQRFAVHVISVGVPVPYDVICRFGLQAYFGVLVTIDGVRKPCDSLGSFG